MSGRRPLVGVTCDFLPVRDETKFTSYARYVDALRSAGALAILLPPSVPDVAAHLELVDGVLFTGGDDLDPALWGGAPGAEHLPSDPRRTEYEMALALAAMDGDRPLLGICLGAQLLNVASGGSLRCDLPVAGVTHSDTTLGTRLRHDVDVMKGSLLARSIGMPEGGRVSVNSVHRNAPDGLGEKLRASALAVDGVIEAVEHRDLAFCLGVQWHPEADVATEAASRHLFSSFVEACVSARMTSR
jgi:putative glutamine amidotransferase